MPDSGVSCAIDGDSGSDGDSEIDNAQEGITGLNCAGFGSSMVVTASFGLIAAGHVLRLLAAPAASVVASPVQTADALL